MNWIKITDAFIHINPSLNLQPLLHAVLLLVLVMQGMERLADIHQACLRLSAA